MEALPRRPFGLSLPHAAIDDRQLGWCRLLCELLIEPRMRYSELERGGKLAVMRKETDRRRLGDFGWQRPFLARLSRMLDEAP